MTQIHVAHLVYHFLALVEKGDDALFGVDVALDSNDLAPHFGVPRDSIDLLGGRIDRLDPASADDDLRAVDRESDRHALADA